MMQLFPQPRDLEMLPGTCHVPGGFGACDLLTFFRLVRSGNEVRVGWNTVPGREEYEMEIGEDGITLRVSGEESLFRAVTSLHQLIRRFGEEIPCMRVKDRPAFARRGYMLDISRGRKPRMETLRTMIDYLVSLKYNELQLYMEGDCFKYAAYPEETKDFDCLTPEDILELDRYCRERFMDLVPNQNSFGHMYTWLKKPAFRHLGLYGSETEVPSTLNPTLPESFDFMCSLYRSLLPYFSSEYVNIGLDEAYGLGKYQIEEYCREKGKDQVFLEWLNKLSGHITEQYGKKIMLWADMIYDYPSIYKQLPEGAIALEWGYELIQSQRMTAHCIAYRDAGIRYYVCPSVNTHDSLSGRMDVTTFNIRTCGELGEAYGAEGLLLTDWGSTGHPQSWVWSMNPIALGGQYAWNTGARQDGETFKADFIRSAEQYVDEYFFRKVPLSRLLYRMANYYLLEPERVHVCTMCAKEMLLPMNETRFVHLFDLKDSGDDFYFDNVTAYVRKIMADIEHLSFDEEWKREIRLTAKLIELGSGICRVKLHPDTSASEALELAGAIDGILPEFEETWKKRNYEKGVERFTEHLRARQKEMRELAKA